MRKRAQSTGGGLFTVERIHVIDVFVWSVQVNSAIKTRMRSRCAYSAGGTVSR